MRRMKSLMVLISMAVMTIAAGATTVVPMNVDELSAASTQVLVGRAGESWSAWDSAHHTIYTYTRFNVSQTLKGQAAQTVTLKQMGGSSGGTRLVVHGIRYFQPGEKAVVFVHASEAGDGTMVITGLMQGNFQVRNVNGTEMASNGVRGVERLDERSHVVSEYVGTQIPLRDLAARVRRQSHE